MAKQTPPIKKTFEYNPADSPNESPSPTATDLDTKSHNIEIVHNTMDISMTDLTKKTVEDVVRKSHCYKEMACKIKKILDWNTTGGKWRCVVGKFQMFFEKQFDCSITLKVDDFMIFVYPE